MINELSLQIFSSGTSPIKDAASDLERISNISYSTGYPGGLYLNSSMDVPRDIVKGWLIKGAQRLRILNGVAVVFEGQIANLDRALSVDRQMIQILGVGYWGSLLSSRRLSRYYADLRTSANVWRELSGADFVVEFVNIARYDEDQDNNMLRIIPQAGVAWGAADRIRLQYRAPVGESIRRIDFDYDFSEGAQVWTTKLQENGGDETTYWSQTSTASATGQNIEPADSPNAIDFFLTSTNAQTTPNNQSVYAELANIVVYATMNHIPAGGKDTVDLTEIVKDIRGELSELSTDEDLIASNTLGLIPFVAHRFPTMADILSRASAYGDASANRWATGIRGSHLASDALPKIFSEQYPDLTAGFDYTARIDEPNMVPPFNITEGYIGSDENRVWNWIIVEYTDEQGFTQFVTPDDDATLKDATSITDFGQRDFRLPIGHSTQTVAVNVGKRFLATHKDAAWSIKGPISIKNYIRGPQGQRIPAAEIRSGMRLKIESFLKDPATGADELIFLITRTDYNDTDQVCRMTVGIPNSLDVYLAQRELVDERLLG